jgi:phosphate transport system protein
LATKSLDSRDGNLAAKVIEGDLHIDHLEVDLEEDCLKVLALYQPVAIDLRFIVAVLKINSDLERIGDLAVNIAERASFLATQRRVEIPIDFLTMSEKAQGMLRKSLDALANLDANLAYKVCASDDEVDAMNREMYRLVQDAIRKHPERLECLIHMLSASRHLERIADLATDISEDVIYMVKGEIIRHRTEDFKAQRLKR